MIHRRLTRWFWRKACRHPRRHYVFVGVDIVRAPHGDTLFVGHVCRRCGAEFTNTQYNVRGGGIGMLREFAEAYLTGGGIDRIH